jgi:hypothetical protein
MAIRRRLGVAREALRGALAFWLVVAVSVVGALWFIAGVINLLGAQFLPERLKPPPIRDVATTIWDLLPGWLFIVLLFLALAVGCLEYAYKTKLTFTQIATPPIKLAMRGDWQAPQPPPPDPYSSKNPSYFYRDRGPGVYMEGGGVFGDLINSEAYMTLNDLMAHLADVVEPKPSLTERA